MKGSLSFLQMIDTMTYGVAPTNKKKCLILSKGKRNYMWYMYKMKIDFLTLISKSHV
jgi:hypothetical protein